MFFFAKRVMDKKVKMKAPPSETCLFFCPNQGIQSHDLDLKNLWASRFCMAAANKISGSSVCKALQAVGFVFSLKFGWFGRLAGWFGWFAGSCFQSFSNIFFFVNWDDEQTKWGMMSEVKALRSKQNRQPFTLVLA